MKKGSFSLHERKKIHASIRGFSAIEIVIAVALVAMIAVVIAPMFTVVNRAWDKDKRLKEMAQKSRDAMDFMIHELKKTNGIIDGRYDPDFVGTSTLSEGYVVFSTGGEEYYLDNRNSGYQMDTSSLFKVGTAQGGFAGDYDGTATGVATFSFSTMTTLPGAYDLYAYFISTGTTDINTSAVSVSVYDDANTDISSTFCQGPGNASKWYKVCDSDTATADCGATRVDFSETSQYRSIRVACFGANPPCTAACATYNSIVDGFKLVYKGARHKVFYYDSATNKITFGDDNPDNVVDNDDPVAQLANNPTLIDNVAPLTSTTSIFTYWKADGVSPVDSGGDPGEVALVRIAFQINDPEGKVSPYELRGQAEIRSAGSGSQNKVVINEVMYAPAAPEIAFDDFQGSFSTGSVLPGMDNHNYGWTTEYGGVNYGWTSVDDNLQDGDANGWELGASGTWGYEAADAISASNVISGAITNTDNHKSNFYIFERSVNYKMEFSFRVVGFAGNTTPWFGAFLRQESPTSDSRGLVTVELMDNGSPAGSRAETSCPVNDKIIRVRVRKNGAGGAFNTRGVACGVHDFTSALHWHTIRIVDVFGKISVSIGDAGGALTEVLSQVEYNTSNVAAANRPDASTATKALFVWDVAAGTATHVHFDDIKITSYDFKPVAYLNNFDDTLDIWQKLSVDGQNASPWERGTPENTENPGKDFPSPRGPIVWGTEIDTPKEHCASSDCDEILATRSIVTGDRYSFISLYWFQWMKLKGDKMDIAAVGLGPLSSPFVEGDFVFPEEDKIYCLSGGDCTYNAYPNIYDDVYDPGCPPDDDFCGRRLWVSGHDKWAQMRLDLRSSVAANDFFDDTLSVKFRNASQDSAGESGWYVDDIQAYPGGVWEIIDNVTGNTNPPCCNPNAGGCTSAGTYSCYAIPKTSPAAGYPNYIHAALETPPVRVINPDGTSPFGVTISWDHWTDFESAGGGSDDAYNYDGGFLEFSTEFDATHGEFVNWQQVPSSGLNYPYDDFIETDTGSSNTNELQGKEGWTFFTKAAGNNKTQAWQPITAYISDEGLAGKVVKFRWVFASDCGDSGECPGKPATDDGGGWGIDNVKVGLLSDPRCEFIELYNPTPYTMDVNNYRIYTDTHPGSGDVYDTIGGDALNGSGATTIAPGGYGIVTGVRTAGSYAYAGTSGPCEYAAPPADSVSTRRLVIDQAPSGDLAGYALFGYKGLGNDYGTIRLTDGASDNLLDYVPYNIVFYDDLESGVSTSLLLSQNNFGTATDFMIGKPGSLLVAGDTSVDYTLDARWGRFSTCAGCGGSSWLLSAPSQEAYTQSATTDLRLPVLSFTGLTDCRMQFSYFAGLEGSTLDDDAMILQIDSEGGGGDFGSAGTFTQWVSRRRVSPGYDTRLQDGNSPFNGNSCNEDGIGGGTPATPTEGTTTACYGYSYDRNWRRIYVNFNQIGVGNKALYSYEGYTTNFRFFFAADTADAPGDPGIYIDDIAVYCNWGAKYVSNSLERKSWTGNPSVYSNWVQSTAAGGTPGAKNTCVGCN